jgi:hypothetical protein
MGGRKERADGWAEGEGKGGVWVYLSYHRKQKIKGENYAVFSTVLCFAGKRIFYIYL